jgi:hypothetical protein
LCLPWFRPALLARAGGCIALLRPAARLRLALQETRTQLGRQPGATPLLGLQLSV